MGLSARNDGELLYVKKASETNQMPFSYYASASLSSESALCLQRTPFRPMT